MTADVIDLAAAPLQSRVLSHWLAGRDGAAARAAVQVDLSQFPVVQNAATVASSDRDGMMALFAPVTSSSGFAVNERTAMQVSTVYACMTKLAGAITQLPVHQYRVNLVGDRERLEPTPLWWLLNESPADNWTAASWKEWIIKCVGLRGDQHTEILRRGAQAIGLKVHHPDFVQPRLVSGRLRYDVMDPVSGRLYGVDQDDMLHFAGFGFDGIRSLSMISFAARQAIGNSLAAADFAGRTLGEGAMPQIALTYPNKMSAEAAALLRTSFVATYGGSGGRKLPLVLTEGGTAKELSISPVDLELMAMRKFEKAEICEAFGVPPIIIGDADKNSAWGTGIEQVILGFVRFTIKPHLRRWQEELNRKLFRRAGQFVEFDLDELMTGDAKSQAEYSRAALGGPGTGNGWMTVNEVRRRRNLPPIEGGEELFRAQATPPKTGQAQPLEPAEPLDPNEPTDPNAPEEDPTP